MARIADRAEKGRKLKEIPICTWHDLEAAKRDYWKWDSYNRELLRQLFTNEELSEEYAGSFGTVLGVEPNLGDDTEEFRREVGDKVHCLESISERLELIPLSDEVTGQLEGTSRTPASTTRVFVVHGHDEAVQQTVARFLEKLDLEIGRASCRVRV